ncbi:MAG: hypothetical protein A2008_11555 [Candidatus Wallbacteria bacterium GWC2_49_35]|uniref:Uncharacterized protein n=1 Tax=Candidatus Wallbacteria bacterium GWC2_49_35 TaxID=1817813 RepID=A0A1F7WUY5_9BACT|nr:MAG: hypothetical protein A2008_11555 [Candidatus Wallbacteria bacterium GWC2_49_35]
MSDKVDGGRKFSDGRSKALIPASAAGALAAAQTQKNKIDKSQTFIRKVLICIYGTKNKRIMNRLYLDNRNKITKNKN